MEAPSKSHGAAMDKLDFARPDDEHNSAYLSLFNRRLSLSRLLLITVVLCGSLSVFLILIEAFWGVSGFQFLSISHSFNPFNSVTETRSVDIPGQSPAPVSLTEYVQWHKEMRKCFLDNASCTTGKPPPALLWRCPLNNSGACAGVGDRLRGIQFALLLAMITKRLLLIEWPKMPFALSMVAQPASIDWRVPDGFSSDGWPEANWFACVTPRPCLAAGHLPSDDHLPGPDNAGPDINLGSSNISSMLADAQNLAVVTRATEDSFALLQRNPVAMSDFADLAPSNISPTDLQRHILQLLFQPSASVGKVLDDLIPAEFKHAGYVAVHARTGYDVGESEGGRFKNINEGGQLYAMRMLECALDTDEKLYPRIFLASDSIRFKKLFTTIANGYGSTVVYTEVPGFHFGLRSNISDDFTDAEAWAGFLNVFVDFFGIAGSQVIITNGSGFARMAYLLSNTNTWRIARIDGKKCM